MVLIATDTFYRNVKDR